MSDPSTSDGEDDAIRREIERKLEILRQRAEAYEAFVSPPDHPPLLWQMAMLADAGFTILPRVVDPDPSKAFPEMHVTMRPLDWSDEHYCLVGGYEFAVMRVPASYHGHLMRPKPVEARYFIASDALPLPPSSYEVEHYRRIDYVLAIGGRPAWRSRIMVCAGSRIDTRVRVR